MEVRIDGPVTRLVVSFSGEVNVDNSEEPEVPPLLFARWCVGVAGGGVTVTCVFEETCDELRWLA